MRYCAHPPWETTVYPLVSHRGPLGIPREPGGRHTGISHGVSRHNVGIPNRSHGSPREGHGIPWESSRTPVLTTVTHGNPRESLKKSTRCSVILRGNPHRLPRERPEATGTHGNKYIFPRVVLRFSVGTSETRRSQRQLYTILTVFRGFPRKPPRTPAGTSGTLLGTHVKSIKSPQSSAGIPTECRGNGRNPKKSRLIC